MSANAWRNPLVMMCVVLWTSLIATATAQAQQCVAPPDDMVAWWPGDGTSLDVHAQLHGVAQNGAGYAPGMVGEAFSFNGLDEGQDDRIDLPPSALHGLTEMTVEMWVQTQDDVAAFYSAAGPKDPALSNEAFLLQNTRGVMVGVRQVGSGSLPFFLNDGAWHHVAFVRSGSLGMFYLDGVMVDARGVPAEAFDVGPGGFMLGQEQDCLGGCFTTQEALDGMIDEFTIYRRALSDTEILTIYEAGSAGKCKPMTEPDPELVAELEAAYQEIDELDMMVASLETDLTASNARADELEMDLAASNARTGELETEIGQLKARIAELEANGGVEPGDCECRWGERTCEFIDRWERKAKRWKKRWKKYDWRNRWR